MGHASGQLNVFATVPEWGALASELGGDKVSVYTATNALQDPHHVEAKPSLIARARNADLVVATGAELEVGWLPLVLRQAGNPKVQPGKPGYFEATQFVTLLEKPTRSTAPTATCIRGQSAHPDRSAQHRARRAPLRRAGRARSRERRALSGALRAFATLERGDREWEKQARRSRACRSSSSTRRSRISIAWLG
jgi:zinc/manganese transport system substrate-binding protein